MTLKEIAKEAGVSVSTVSRVVNQRNTRAASPEVQKKIWEIVRRTGYIPSVAAQTLQSRRSEPPSSGMVACVFARNSVSVWDNAYFTGIEQSFEKEMLRFNYLVQCFFTDLDILGDNIQNINPDNRFSGIIIIGRHKLDVIRRLRKYFHHIVYAGMMLPPSNKYDSVVCDSYNIGCQAAQYFLNLGHRRIAYLGDTDNEARFNGFCDILNANNIPKDDQLHVKCALSIESGYMAAQKLFENTLLPSAIFCMNDEIAIGAMRAIQDFGLRVPQDISVMGVDDTEAARYTSPKLTSIHSPMQELGSIAAKILVDRINNGHTIGISVSLPFYIVERDSCTAYNSTTELQRK